MAIRVYDVACKRSSRPSADVIVTLDGSIPERMKVKEVEVLPANHTLDLGRVTTR